MTDQTTIITIDDVQAGKISERTVSTAAPRFDHDPIAELQERVFKTAAERNLSHKLVEAFVNTPDAFSLLRDGIRYLAFTAFGQRERSFDAFTRSMPSNRPQEEYLRDAGLGTMPKTISGEPAPLVLSGFDGGVTIKNERYAQMIEVTGDDLRFDRVGKLRQIAPELGISAANTIEAAIYAVITTTGNFTRNQTTGDNDIGANTAATTLSGLGLEAAYTTIATAKDRRSGSYLGLLPDTIICGPRNKFPIMQLLMSDSIVRASANNTAEVRGTGQTPIYRGLIRNIIVSPWFATTANGYQWALCDSTRTSLVMQEVEPFNVLQESMDASSEAWLVRNSLRYVASMYFGVGLADDRPWYYSSSTTAATIS
jgi:hypothetical protein